METLGWTDEKGREMTREPLIEGSDMHSSAAAARSLLLERLAELDDGFMDLYLEADAGLCACGAMRCGGWLLCFAVRRSRALRSCTHPLFVAYTVCAARCKGVHVYSATAHSFCLCICTACAPHCTVTCVLSSCTYIPFGPNRCQQVEPCRYRRSYPPRHLGTKSRTGVVRLSPEKQRCVALIQRHHICRTRTSLHGMQPQTAAFRPHADFLFGLRMGAGIQPLLDAVVRYLPSPLDAPAVQATGLVPDPKAKLCALAFKVMYNQQRGMLCVCVSERAR